MADRFGASVVSHFNVRVTHAPIVGCVQSKSDTDYTEQRQHHQH
jgi:hypothetical protein